ncbi:hypothetical protein Tco_0940363 [Tanacetum coccineum]|uniref:Uncharacterized protein n=1 Tax=Tanacetum coccineum TaxID=301880 RepID=A0ABQ5DQD3_9ASTR
MLFLSLHATLHFSSLQTFQKFTCINSGIQFTSMTLSTDLKRTKGRDSNSLWKSSEISLRSALEYKDKTLMHFILMKKFFVSPEHKSFEGIYHQKNVDYVELLWEDFIYQINNRAYKKQEKIYYPRLTKVIIHYFLTQDKIVSWRNKIEMHTSRDDYLINTLRFVSAKEETQIYGAILPESLTSPEIKETKAYKTYLGFTTGATPPKKARKFKKQASPQLTIVPVLTKEPTGKSKRVKRHAKKSTKAPARGVIIRETPEMPLYKKKEKVDVTRGKGIKLLSQVALNEDAQFEEVQKKSMMDFHKTHPSGYGAVKIIPSVISEGTNVKPGVPCVTEEESSKNDSDDDKIQSDNENESDSEHETDENESGSKSDQDENEEDIGDDEEEITDKAEGDEDEEMDYTTSQLYDDADIRLNEPVDTDKGLIQKEGIDAAMTNVQQGNENPEILQVIEDAHVTLSTISHKTQVLVTSSSHSSDLEAKFLNFSDIPYTDAELVSPMDVYVHHEVPSKQLLILTVQVSYARLGATRDEFMNCLSSLSMALVHRAVKIQYFLRFSTRSSVNFDLSDPKAMRLPLKKILIDKMDKSESYLATPEHRECYDRLIKSYDLDKSLFLTYDKVYSLKRIRKDKDKDEDPSAGSDRGLPSSKVTSLNSNLPRNSVLVEEPMSLRLQNFKTCHKIKRRRTSNDDEKPKEKVASKRVWFIKPTQPQEPIDPDWNAGKTPQHGQIQSWLMTLDLSA